MTTRENVLAVARVVLDTQEAAGGEEAEPRAGARAGEFELAADAAGRESSQVGCAEVGGDHQLPEQSVGGESPTAEVGDEHRSIPRLGPCCLQSR